MTIPPLLVPFLGMGLAMLFGAVEVSAFGFAALPLVYVVAALLGAGVGVWWFFVGSRQ
jgi:hypothetical protein